MDFLTGSYIDAVVSDLIRRPETVLERLALPPLPEIHHVQMSRHFYLNNIAVPLPKLSDEKRSEIRLDIDKALEKLTRWERQEVPKLQLEQIRRKHRERVSSGNTVNERVSSGSTTTYHTAREHTEVHTEVRTEVDGTTAPINNAAAVEDGSSAVSSVTAAAPVILNQPIIPAPMIPDQPITPAAPVILNQPVPKPTDLPKPAPVTATGRLVECPYSESPVVTRVAPPSDRTTVPSSMSGGLVAAAPYQWIKEEDEEGEEWLSTESSGCESDSSEDSLSSDSLCETQMTTLSALSPPSHKVLQHLEALEAAIELDLSMTTRRKLEFGPLKSPTSSASAAPLKSPPTSSATAAVPPLKLSSPTAAAPSKGEGLVTQAQGDTPENSPRRNISFYVEVDSPNVTTRRGSRSVVKSREGTSSTVTTPRDTVTTPRDTVTTPRNTDSTPRDTVSTPRDTVTTPRVAVSERKEEGDGGDGSSSPLVTPRRLRCDSYKTTHSQVFTGPASKIGALVRGYLTRRLYGSYKVQEHIKTIRDTRAILLSEGDIITDQDRAFNNRLLETLRNTKAKVGHIFHEMTLREQLQLIANTRAAKKEVYIKEGRLVKSGSERKRLVKKSVRQKAWI